MTTALLARPMTNMEAARRQKGWSQYQLGGLTHIHQTWISAFERGRGIPTPEELSHLSRVLDVPADKLLEPVGRPEVPDLVEPSVTEEEATR